MTQQTPMEFIKKNMLQFEEEHGRKPAVMLVSKDLLKDLFRESKHHGLLPQGTVFSITLLLNTPMKLWGCEIALIGGEKRMALL